MHSLRAINPNRVRGVDHDRVRRRCRRAARHGHETAVETSCAGCVHGDGLARLREGGLCHGVVVGRELELHHVADGGFDVVGRVGEGAVCAADFHDVHDDLAC